MKSSFSNCHLGALKRCISCTFYARRPGILFFPFEKCIKPLDFSIMSDKKRHRNSSRATADRNEKSRDNNVQMRCLLRSNANLMNAIHLIVAGSALLVAQAAWLLLLLTQLFKLRRFRHHFHGEEEREKTKSSTLSSQVLVHSWNEEKRWLTGTAVAAISHS